MSDEPFGRDATAEEAEILHTAGFHEVKGLDGVWQYGSVRSKLGRAGGRKEAKTYTLDEALQEARRKLQGGN